MNVIVFTGPTISAADVKQLIDAECRPPAAAGDVYRAALLSPKVIAIIDGYFERIPSVWHKEILWAMSQGIHVYGSASMGALRAAELAAFGMVGVGKVFEAYRDGVLEDDDEVAVSHGATTETYHLASEAMVNIRATLAKAVEERVIDGQGCDALLGIAKSLFYPERSWARVLELGSEQRVAGIDTLREWLGSGRINQKRDDAIAMLQAIRELLASAPAPKQVTYTFEETMHWEEFVLASADPKIEQDDSPDRQVLEELDRDPEAAERVHAAALGWWFASEFARRQGHAVDAMALLEQSQEFCARHNLQSAEDVARWLANHHLDHADVLFTRRALARWAESLAPRAVTACVVDYLRWTGEYRELLERASVKKP